MNSIDNSTSAGKESGVISDVTNDISSDVIIENRKNNKSQKIIINDKINTKHMSSHVAPLNVKANESSMLASNHAALENGETASLPMQTPRLTSRKLPKEDTSIGVSTDTTHPQPLNIIISRMPLLP